KQPPREVLQPHANRTNGAHARNAGLASAGGGNRPNSGRIAERGMRTRASRIGAAVRQLLHRDEAERELDDELRAYFESAVEAKVTGGMGRAVAEREAR